VGGLYIEMRYRHALISGKHDTSKGRFAGCAPAFGREEEDCFSLSQRLPLQRARRASGRAGLTCGRDYGAWILLGIALSRSGDRSCMVALQMVGVQPIRHENSDSSLILINGFNSNNS
jgi:hypothetical protein